MKYDKRGWASQNPIKRIFCDFDGVLLNFEEQLFIWANKLRIDQSFGIQYAFDQLEKHPNYTEQFWATMPWIKNGKELYRFCAEITPTYILTAPSNNPLSSYGKHIWINNNLKTMDFALCPAKWACASKDTLLIDDNKKKCDRFMSAGGHAFLYNPERFEDCKEFIKEFLK